MVILEIDAGNTFVKWRKRNGNALVMPQRWYTEEIKQQGMSPPVEWGDVELATLVSVAPKEVTEVLTGVLVHLGIPMKQVVSESEFLGLKNAYAKPQQMGADRWVAMLAAWKQCHTAFCVVDAGSAVTVDCVDAQGQHLGGYILPGLTMMKRSLLGSTAQVRWQGEGVYQKIELGKNTAECVEQGCRYQLAALMRQIQLDCEQQKIGHLFITGGDAEQLLPWSGPAKWMPNLVLDGLRYFRD